MDAPEVDFGGDVGLSWVDDPDALGGQEVEALFECLRVHDRRLATNVGSHN